MTEPTDRKGKPVRVGTQVRILAIRPSVLARLPEEERSRVESMLGQVLKVDEIDEYNAPWVTMAFPHEQGKATTHSLALSAEEFEVVDG
jgi:hypothetical protein